MHLQGYIDKSGKWVIPPQFSRAEQFANEDGTARVTFGVRKFNKEKWHGGGSRLDLLNAFIVQYGLLQMKRNRIYELLGKPDKMNGTDDEYTIYAGHGGYSSVLIRYKDNVVVKYRMNYMKPEDWYDKDHPNTGDAQATDKTSHLRGQSALAARQCLVVLIASPDPVFTIHEL